MTKNKRLDKFAIAAALQEIAALLELKGGKDRFKARAYQAGARVIAGMSEDIGEVVLENRLTSMRGIGDALASQIEQLYLTGESSVLRGLKKEFPPGIIELSGVPGLSISKIKTLHEALGITSVAELKAAAEAGKIKDIKGFGAKTEAKLLETISGTSSAREELKSDCTCTARCKRRTDRQLSSDSRANHRDLVCRLAAALEGNCRHNSHRRKHKAARER